MPKLNELKLGHEIGKKHNSWFIYASCENCGKCRWITYIKSKGIIRDRNRCQSCSNANRKGRGYMGHIQASTSRETDWRRRGIKLTEQEFNQKFEQQDGCCAVCGIPQSALKNRLYVDHNHQTGKVRGLVCPNCNFFVGCLENKDGIIKKAKDYLKKFL